VVTGGSGSDGDRGRRVMGRPRWAHAHTGPAGERVATSGSGGGAGCLGHTHTGPAGEHARAAACDADWIGRRQSGLTRCMVAKRTRQRDDGVHRPAEWT
jgi:hypothetical protein